MKEELTPELLQTLMAEHDQIILSEDVEDIDFYESFEENGERVLYLGTAESFAKWKREQLQ